MITHDPVSGHPFFLRGTTFPLAGAAAADFLGAVLRAAGASYETVLKTTIFVQDLNDFAAVNEVYGRYFPVDPPARATVQAARLPRDVKVELEAIAFT